MLHSDLRFTRLLVLLAAGVFLAAGCGDDDEPGDGNGNGNGGGATCESPIELTSADISGDTTLDRDCYQTGSSLSITSGTLELAPGTVLRFGQNAGLSVSGEGRLRADGEADNPVRLTGTEDSDGFWQGVRMSGTRSEDNDLSHLVIENAGANRWSGAEQSQACLYLQGDDIAVSLDNLTLRGCRQAGLVVDGREADFELTNTTITGSDSPLWMTAGTVDQVADNNEFTDNEDNRLHVITNGTIGEDVSWVDPGIPLFVRTALNIDNRLELTPGTTLQFDNNIGADIGPDGALVAAGTEEQPISFIGATEERGFWRGIRFEQSSSSDNLLERAVVAHAGASRWTGGEQSQAGIYLQGGPATATIRNTRIENHEVVGLSIESDDADVTVEGNAFVDNAMPARIAPNIAGQFSADQTFSDNDDSWVRVDTGTVGDQQTWSALEVPYRVFGEVNVAAPLTLAPGLTAEFEQDNGLDVQPEGQLTADASGGEAITMTGAEQLQGYWQGIRFESTRSDNNRIVNADLLFAGSRGWTGGQQSRAAVYLQGNSLLELNNARIETSGLHGVSVDGGSELRGCNNLSFAEISGTDLLVGGSASIAAGCQQFVEPAE